MTNKLIILLSVIIIAGAALFIIFHKTDTSESISAIDGIPKNTAILVKANGILPLLTSISENNILRNAGEGSNLSLSRLRSVLDSLCSESAFLSDIINDSTIYFAIVDNNKDKNGLLFLFPVPVEQNLSEVKNVLSPFFTNIGLELNDYSNSKDKSKANVWYLHIHKGLLLISDNKQNIKESLLVQSSKSSFSNDTSFQKVFRASGSKVPATLYLNYKHLPAALKSLINPSYASKAKKMFYSDGWAALDINVSDNSIVVQGFSSSAATNFMGSRLLRIEQPVECDFYNYIPNNAFSVSSFYLSDAYNFRMLQSELLKQNKDYEKVVKSIRKNTDNEIDTRLAEILGKAAGYFITCEKGEYNNVFLINCNSNVTAYEFLKKLENKKHTEKQGLADGVELNLSKIIKLPDSHIPYLLAGDFIENKDYPYACNINDYIVFGSSESYLKNYIELIRAEKTILGDTLFLKTAKELLLTRTNINQIILPGQAFAYFSDLFKQDIIDDIKPILGIPGSILGLQVSASNDLSYLNGFIYSGAKSSSENALEWSLKFDTGIIFMDNFSFNNKDASVNFLVQDSAFNIYLLSRTGRIIWQKALDGKILGKVRTIDFFKNNKNQLLLNTCNSLYLIDKNGRNVKDFPIKFKTKAACGVMVADFDGNRNYRLYVALQNKNFVVLTKEGKKVDGWKFRESNYIVYSQPKCFTFDGKDYILLHDSLNIYLLNRKGEQSLHLREKFSMTPNTEIYIDFQKQYFRLVTSDIQANIRIIYPDGRIVTKRTVEPTSGVSSSFLNNNEISLPEITFTDSNKLYTYNLSGDLLFQEEFEGKISANAQFFYAANNNITSCASFGGNIQISVRDQNRKVVKAVKISGDYPFIFLPLFEKKSNQYILTSKGDSILYYKVF